MTTERGVPLPRQAAHHVDTLRRRHDWLVSLVDAGTATGYHREELTALAWALPVLEAEHGAVLRLWRDVLDPADALARHEATKTALRELGRHTYRDDPADAGEANPMRRHCEVCGLQRSRHPGAKQIRAEVPA